MKNISSVLRKNSLCPFNASTKELLGEHNFNVEDSKTVRVKMRDLILWDKTFLRFVGGYTSMELKLYGGSNIYYCNFTISFLYKQLTPRKVKCFW